MFMARTPGDGLNRRMINLAVIAFAPLALAGCVVVPPPDSTLPQPAGYAVPLGQPVRVSDLVLTPKKLVEDSRCPMNRSEEHTSELQSPCNLVCRLLLEKKKKEEVQSQI